MEKLPAQMTAVAISKPGGPEVLIPEQRPVPQPGADEILIKVQAAGVNRPDVAQRSGSYPPPPGASDLPGLEVAGVVAAVGSNAKRHKVGDRVMSLVAGGGYAQYCIAQDAQAMAVPPSLTMAGGRRASGNADDGVAQCVRARRAQTRRDAPCSRWLLRHRHHGDHAGESAGIEGDRHRRLEGQGRRLPQARRRSRHQLQEARTSSRPPRSSPSATAPMSSSTWSAATISTAIMMLPPSTAASCRSRSCRMRRRPPPTSSS